MPNKLRVAVLMGGPSSEHEVSLNTAKNVINNLDPAKYHAESILIDKKGEWPFRPELMRGKVDTAFIAMHGSYGEDGTVQSILDAAKIPYTGSGALTSALAMNKFLSLEHFRRAGLTVPQTLFAHKHHWIKDTSFVLRQINSYLEYPIVVKPNRAGSSVGVNFASHPNELAGVLQKAFELANDLVLQPHIRGREVTCAVLDHGMLGTAYALPPTEIVPVASHFFDYKSKYDPEGALEITPARLPNPWLREIKKAALMAHNAIHARGMSRTDMILGNDGKIYVLEINTIPGMTENSLLPKAARTFGISFPALLDSIINASFLSFYGRR